MGRLDFLRSSDPGYVPQLEKELTVLRQALNDAQNTRESAWVYANDLLIGHWGDTHVPPSTAPLLNAFDDLQVVLRTNWHYDPKTDTAEGLPKVIILGANRKMDNEALGLNKPFEMALLLGPVDSVVEGAILDHRKAHMIVEETQSKVYALQELVAKLK